MFKNLNITLPVLVLCAWLCHGCSSEPKKKTEILDAGFEPSGPLFRNAIPNQDAWRFIDSFQKNYTLDLTHGVYYDTADLRNYLDQIFPRLIQAMGDSVDFKWKVGFHFMRKQTDKGSRMDVLVVPTRVRNDTVFDFFTHRHLYVMSPITVPASEKKPPCTNCPGYDAGQLWP